MPNELTKKYFDRLWPIDLYKFTSFLCALIIWPSFYYHEENFFSHGHFTTAFLIGNGYFYFSTYNLTELVKRNGQIPLYFLFQTISLIGIGLAHQTNTFIYLSIMPVLMSMYYFSVISGTGENFKQKKSLFIYAFGFCGLLLFESFKKGNIFTYGEIVALSSFAIWAFSTAYWGFEMYFKGRKRFLSRLFSMEETKKVSSSRFDRMFFHDIVNHTHALMLFLKTKRNDDHVDKQDIENILNEVKLLQETIHQHFGFEHKDISKGQTFVPFQLAMARVYNLIDAYFPNSKDVFVSLKGHLGGTQDLESIRRCTVDIVSFHRVMTNILKNAYEAGSDRVDCLFDYQDDGLYVQIRNNLNKLQHGKMNLDKDLGRTILSFDRKSSDHLGIESINRICQDSGGNFKFFIKDGHWYNEFYLPSESLMRLKKNKDYQKAS